MKPEVLFFRYAFPCTRVILDRGGINQETYSNLEKLAKEGKSPTFDELEKIYKNAFEIMQNLYGKKYKHKKSVESYWIDGDHNKEIDEHPNYKDKSEEFKAICKVRKVKITGKAPFLKDTIGWFMFKENERDEEQLAWNPYNIELKKGETVNIHHNIIVEKL
ncbi:MAG: hypothetical protein KKB03_03975 [Nanoarchaeota archaeon]|nr:hypothetical protein [Nanoarchaeota archaeon]MBU1135564.1 hypothetical protein [Nanoarchaeota archaeon]MBU2520371.1 hypothetical protein [Nanoarchaeota archaeon]